MQELRRALGERGGMSTYKKREVEIAPPLSHWRGSMASFVFIFAELVRPELRCGGEGLLVFSSNMAADKWQSLTSLRGTNTEIS